MIYTTEKSSKTPPPTPTRTLPEDIKLPFNWGRIRDFPVVVDGYKAVKVRSNVSDQEFNEVINSNPTLCERFFRLEKNLYYEDVDGNESEFHQEVANRCMQLFGASEVLNIFSDRLRVHTNHPTTSGAADVAILSRRPNSFARYLGFVVEVTYAVDLATTHQRIVQYFNQNERLQVAWLIMIEYPWRREDRPPRYYEPNNGTMVIFHYSRLGSFPHPDWAISFGNDQIDIVNRNRYRVQTGINENAFGGWFGGSGDPPCNQPDLVQYQVSVMARDIYFADQDPDATGMPADVNNVLQNYIQHHNQQELAITVDLYDLKYQLIQVCIPNMNVDLKTVTDSNRPCPSVPHMPEP